MLIDNKILIELKAMPFMDRNWNAKVINYLRVFNIEVGLLLNFGMPSLQFKRFLNTKEICEIPYNPIIPNKHV